MRATIKLKLGLAFAIVIVLSAVSAGLGINGLAVQKAQMNALVNGPELRLQTTQELFTDLLQALRALRALRAQKNMLLSGDNQADLAKYNAQVLGQRDVLTARLDRLGTLATADDSQ